MAEAIDGIEARINLNKRRPPEAAAREEAKRGRAEANSSREGPEEWD
jgi:hypothetical protein